MGDQAEIWKDIPGHEGRYEASSFGRIRSLPKMVGHNTHPYLQKGRILRPSFTRCGYSSVALYKDGVPKRHKVSRLVCAAFHGQPLTPDMQAAHGNGDQKDNRPENLRWATIRENFDDKIRHGKCRGVLHPQAKLTEEQVLQIRSLLAAGHLHSDVAAQFEVVASTIGKIARREIWQHIGGEA